MSFDKEAEALRQVGLESSKTHLEKLRSGFYERFMGGAQGLDIGYAGHTSGRVPILSSALGIDMDYPGYNGLRLPFANETQDYVYSSHFLEHVSDYITAIREQFRVLKTGGFLIIIVPHMYLYEKKWTLPSLWNPDHQRLYTPASLLLEIEGALLSPSPHWRLRYCEDGDSGYDYTIPAHQHARGQYEITAVVQKLKPPAWALME